MSERRVDKCWGTLHQFLSDQLRDVAGERWPAAKHVIRDCAERVNVGASVESNTRLHLFGRHVFGSPDYSTRGWASFGCHFRSIRIRQSLPDQNRRPLRIHLRRLAFRAAVLHQKDVCGFQISMQDAYVVRSINSGYDLAHDVCMRVAG